MYRISDGTKVKMSRADVWSGEEGECAEADEEFGLEGAEDGEQVRFGGTQIVVTLNTEQITI